MNPDLFARGLPGMLPPPGLIKSEPKLHDDKRKDKNRISVISPHAKINEEDLSPEERERRERERRYVLSYTGCSLVANLTYILRLGPLVYECVAKITDEVATTMNIGTTGISVTVTLQRIDYSTHALLATPLVFTVRFAIFVKFSKNRAETLLKPDNIFFLNSTVVNFSYEIILCYTLWSIIHRAYTIQLNVKSVEHII